MFKKYVVQGFETNMSTYASKKECCGQCGQCNTFSWLLKLEIVNPLTFAI